MLQIGEYYGDGLKNMTPNKILSKKDGQVYRYFILVS
jgi:hypothetical protein